MEEEESSQVIVEDIKTIETPYVTGIEPKLLERILLNLKNISNIDQFLNKLTIESSCQTELKIDDLLEKIQLSEEKLLKNKEKKKNLKDQISKLKSELEEQSHILKRVNDEKKNLLRKNEDLQNEIKNYQDKTEDLGKKLRDYEKQLEENANLVKELSIKRNTNLINSDNTATNKDENSSILENNKFNQLIQLKKLKHITKFLNAKEILLFNQTSKTIYNSLISDVEIQRNLIKFIIIKKNTEIDKHKSYEFKKEYELNETEIERMCREYIANKKLVGKDIKKVLLQGVEFLNKEIRPVLGLSNKNLSNTVSQNVSQKKSFIGDVLSAFGGLVKKKMKPNIETITEDEEYYRMIDFDYKAPEEIKGILFKYLTTTTVSQEKLNQFIKEIFNEYSDLIFFANKTLFEIKEVEMVKYVLEERFNKYKNLYIQVENELMDFKKFSATNKEIKDIILKQKNELEVKYIDLQGEVTRIKDDLYKMTFNYNNLKEKSTKVEAEYENIKSLFIKESKTLKKQLEDALKDRSLFRNVIFEFKDYFLNINNELD